MAWWPCLPALRGGKGRSGAISRRCLQRNATVTAHSGGGEWGVGGRAARKTHDLTAPVSAYRRLIVSIPHVSISPPCLRPDSGAAEVARAGIAQANNFCKHRSGCFHCEAPHSPTVPPPPPWVKRGPTHVNQIHEETLKTPVGIHWRTNKCTMDLRGPLCCGVAERRTI